MGRKAKRKFTSKEGLKPLDYFVRITATMMESTAWADLKGTSVKVYVRLKYKGVRTPDNISMTHREAAKIVNCRTFLNCICDLVSHGFIEIVREGGKSQRPNIYRLSDKWRDWPNIQYVLPSYRDGKYKQSKYNIGNFSPPAELHTPLSAELHTVEAKKDGIKPKTACRTAHSQNSVQPLSE